jgi:SAM-dependent methyltransferase
MSLLSKFESTLLAYIRKSYLPVRFLKQGGASPFTDKDIHFFARGAADLSEAFTVSRRELPRNYLNRKEYRSAYLLYFTLTNMVKVMKCLEEACRIIKMPPSTETIEVLDLGCGPATASLACSAFFAERFPQVSLSITGIDQNQEILRDARALFTQLGDKRHALRLVHDIIHPGALRRHLKGKTFDVIIAANVLNEMGGVDRQHALCQLLIDHYLKPNGVFIVVDPALQKTTRSLMEVRDLLRAAILSPCLHQKACPMRAFNKRDWCHFYLEWRCPEIIRKVDRLLGIKHDYLKMAYLIVQKPFGKNAQEGEFWRVVSSPLKSKGRCEFVLCGKGILRRISRLDKDRSENNLSFDRLKRGDIVRIALGVSRIGKSDVVDIVFSFNTLSSYR